MSVLDTLASQIPQELRVKLMQHFGIAKEYEKNPETISITYYCLMYIANEAFKLQKEKQFVSNVLDYLETVSIEKRCSSMRLSSFIFRPNETIHMTKSLNQWPLARQPSKS